MVVVIAYRKKTLWIFFHVMCIGWSPVLLRDTADVKRSGNGSWLITRLCERSKRRWWVEGVRRCCRTGRVSIHARWQQHSCFAADWSPPHAGLTLNLRPPPFRLPLPATCIHCDQLTGLSPRTNTDSNSRISADRTLQRLRISNSPLQRSRSVKNYQVNCMHSSDATLSDSSYVPMT